MEVEDPSDKIVIMAMMEVLCLSPRYDSFSKNVPETLSAIQGKENKYITTEKLTEVKHRRQGKEDQKRKEPDMQ